MTQFLDGERRPAGRHRSGWEDERPEPILPRRRGRVIAFVVAVLVTAATAFLLRTWLRPTEEPAPPNGDSAPLTITSEAESTSGSEASSASASPAPDASESGPENSLVTTPPAPSVSPPPAGVVSSRPQVVPPSDLPAGPALSLSTTGLDFGLVETTASFEVASVGTSEVRFAVGPVPSWLSVTPDGGRVAAGQRERVVVTIDRTQAPAGPVDVGVGVSAVAGNGGGTVRVTAQVGGPPQIVTAAASPSAIFPDRCGSVQRPTQSVVSVTARDSTGIFAVEVTARLPDGRTTTVPLALGTAAGDSSTWSGNVGPATTSGALTFTAVVTDLDGLRSESANSLTVEPCPAA